MSRMNDSSHSIARWSKQQLIKRLRQTANLETFAGNNADFIKQQTWVYREAWLNPVIDELERRLIK